jgi:hypothetical protein
LIWANSIVLNPIEAAPFETASLYKDNHPFQKAAAHSFAKSSSFTLPITADAPVIFSWLRRGIWRHHRKNGIGSGKGRHQKANVFQSANGGVQLCRYRKE